MSRRLLAGLAALAVLSAGIFWSSRRREAPPAPSAPPPAASPVVEGPVPDEALPRESQAWLSLVKGSVYLRLRDHPPRSFTPATVDSPLEPGDMVLTGRDGAAEIALGRESLIRLGPNSALALNALEEGDQELYLALGSLVGKVRAVLSGEMRFHTPTAVAAVRGTELALVYDRASRTTRAGVFREGALTVRSGAGETSLRAGQETAVRHGRAPTQAAPLAALKPLKARVEEVSQRAESLRASWTPKSPEEQGASRRRLLGRETVSIEKLKNLEGVLKPAGFGERAEADPLESMRRKLREDVQKKMTRDKAMEPVRQKLREDVQKKMARDKEMDPAKERLRQDMLRRMEEERRRREGEAGQ